MFNKMRRRILPFVASASPLSLSFLYLQITMARIAFLTVKLVCKSSKLAKLFLL